MTLRQLRHRFLLQGKRFRHRLSPPRIPSVSILEAVPYFGQWESPELIERILGKEISAQDDPRWKTSGAITPEEYEKWSWNCCGMACLKMLLAHARSTLVPTITLAKQCLAYGGYKEPLEESPGLYYQPFLQYLKEQFHIEGKAVSTLTVAEIYQTLARGGYVIASVSPEIRLPSQPSTRKGGHLVLITGYDTEADVIYLHNPSGTKPTNQLYARLTVAEFMKFFDHKGLLLFP